MAAQTPTVVYAIFINGAEAPNCRFVGTYSSSGYGSSIGVVDPMFLINDSQALAQTTSINVGIATLSLVAGDVVTVKNMSNSTRYITGGPPPPTEPAGPNKIGASMNLLKIA